jgi:hypothetical protein
MMGAAARVDLKHFRLYTKDPSPGSSPGKAALKPNSDVRVFAAKRTATVLSDISQIAFKFVSKVPQQRRHRNGVPP